MQTKRRRAPLGSKLLGWAALLLTALAAVRRLRRFALRGKNALITGGSRGLGLEIARLLVARGANVAIVARDEAEIGSACAELIARARSGVRIVGIPCDLLNHAAVDAMLQRVTERLGSVDVLINNAGAMQVGPLDTMSREDFERTMQLHCFAPLRTMLGVRESMRARGGGRIVNITSIGGIVSVPHMLPYCTSKFALVGLSLGLRAELAKERIFVSTIVPGLMRTGSPGRASFKGNHRAEYAWFAISDSLPLLSVSSTRAARRVVRALEQGEAHVIIGVSAKIAALAQGLAPGFVAQLMTMANRLLPKGRDPRPRLGYESESALAPSLLTTLTERAASANNEG